MKEQSIVEGNKLIAVFDGIKVSLEMKDNTVVKGNKIIDAVVNTHPLLGYVGNVSSHVSKNDDIEAIKANLINRMNERVAEKLKYHSSFEWLLPAWKKCYDRLLEINSTSCHVFINDMKTALINVHIGMAFETLVASINFINE